MNPDCSTPQSHSPTEPLVEDPGAYPILFSTEHVGLGSRLDSISPRMRFWAVDKKRANAHWYNDMVAANNRYEEWLTTRPPEEYPVPFREAEKLGEIPDDLRYWAIRPDKSSRAWYEFFVRANARYEQQLAATRSPGKFPFPREISRKYAGKPIEDVPQDTIWWALRPSNCDQGWYQPLYDANKRLLDDAYRTRSPGSETVWFGRYKGHRLDQVYERKKYIHWCFDPEREETGWLCRFKDLVNRLEEWRRAHPERCVPRPRRKAYDIQHPVGEAIGPWDDSSGSAGEDEYEADSFVEPDSDEITAGGGTVDDVAQDSDESTSSRVEVIPIARPTNKRRSRNNVVLSEEESGKEDVPVEHLGKRYRVPLGEQRVEVPTRKSCRRLAY